jgi:predicted Zn-dependent peptidase
MSLEFLNSNDDTFVIMVGFLCGAINEEPRLSGISHMLEHMMFSGAVNKDSENIIKQLTEISLRWNAYTSHDSTVYHIMCLKENAKKALGIVKTLFLQKNLTISKAEFELERQVVIEEYSLKYDHGSFFRTMHSGTPYSAPIIGTLESLRLISLANIKSHHAKYYNHPHIVVMCAKSDQAWIRDSLLPLKHNVPALIDLNTIRTIDKSAHIVVGRNRFVLETCSLGFLAFPMHDMRYNVTLFIEYLLKQRLFNEIRVKKGLVYKINISCTSILYVGCLEIKFSTKSGKCDQVCRIIKAVIDNLSKISNKELSREYDIYITKESKDKMVICEKVLVSNMFVHAKCDKVCVINEFRDAVKVIFDKTRMGIECQTKCNKTDILEIFGLKNNL